MKIRIELDASLEEPEVVIRAAMLTEQIQQIQMALQEVVRKPLVFYKGTSEYFLEIEQILFFETDDAKIFAHTVDNAYEVRLKLYELEDYLPRFFCRVSKSTIVNSKKIYSLDRSFSGSSRIGFYDSHKITYVSRRYQQFLKERLEEMR